MKTKLLSAIFVVVIIIAVVGYRFWYRVSTKPVNDSLHERVKKIVGNDPDLKAEYDNATEDGVLAILEAQAIIDRAGEKQKADRN